MSIARRTGATSLTTLAACVAAFIVLHALAPQWAHSAGLDFWQAAEEAEKQQQAKERRHEIDGLAERLSQQIAAGDAIASAVIEQRMAVDDAIDKLAEVNHGRPGFPEVLRTGEFFNAPERELWERYLLSRIRAKLDDDPSRLAEVLNRLSGR
ncbi:MAG: hypothetical protein U0791_08415 [Gemmataceae bacterium]